MDRTGVVPRWRAVGPRVLAGHAMGCAIEICGKRGPRDLGTWELGARNEERERDPGECKKV